MNRPMNRVRKVFSRFFPRIEASVEDFVEVADRTTAVRVSSAVKPVGSANLKYTHIEYYRFTVGLEGVDVYGNILRYSKPLPNSMLNVREYCSKDHPATRLVDLQLIFWLVDTTRYLQHLGFAVAEPISVSRTELQSLYRRAQENYLLVRLPLD